jgi:hypothetical protein
MQKNKRTKEYVEKMKARIHKRLLSQLQWELAEPYLDKCLGAGRHNQKLKYITFREFKELALKGHSVKAIVKLGYSPHIANFICRFLKGNIKLSKEQLEKEYKTEPLNNICVKHDIRRGDIACLRQMYDIKPLSGLYFERVKKEEPLTQRQKEILYGSMLGDAGRKSTHRIKFVHGGPQRDYLFWKYEQFKNVSSTPKGTPNVNKIYKEDHITWSFYINSNSDVTVCNKLFYQSGPKEVYKEIEQYMSPLAIAVWYSDDGDTAWNYQRRMKNPHVNYSPVFAFCTESFSTKSCENLCDILYSKYNIKSRIKPRVRNKKGITKSYNRIIIENKSNDDFIALIRPHILPMFLRKIDYQEYLKWRK